MIRYLAPAVLASLLLPQVARAEPLRLDTFFKGSLDGTGSVDNNRESTHREFKATMKANWDGPRGTLIEDLLYTDGEKKHIVWTFEKTADGRLVGHRDDLIGEAAISQEGDTIRMKYTAKTRLPTGKIWTLSFDDRLEQISPTTVTMTGDVSYLFIGVGTTRMTIVKSGH
ncbi:DUF3833 family protein [Lichenihabitans psoromatis]|uniref:DUF3833 family protein n=1 Tax=Lichenihabitans psoromatis TaxID=2528642 RepID=UPI0010383F09|nr:DUF3833 family protein [Lichenihabitans psoromatis]